MQSQQESTRSEILPIKSRDWELVGGWMSQNHSAWRLFLVTAVLLGLSGCTVPSEESDTELAASAEKADFAYDAHFDQLAYMSCSAQPAGSFDTSAYFTFRAGAYRAGGLAFRNDFLQQLSREVRGRERQIEYLSMSKLNTKTMMQLSVRSRNNFQLVFSESGAAQIGRDLGLFFSELGTPTTLPLLFDLEPGQRLRYMRNGLPGGLRFESNLYFGSSVTIQNSVRARLNDDSMIALTYTNAQGGFASDARSAADLEGSTVNRTQSVFGKGLIVGFRQPTPHTNIALYSQYPNLALGSVTEINLDSRTNTTGLKPWVCPTSMQFRIVRPGDAGADCTVGPDPAVLSPELAIVRQSLRAEDWYVNMNSRCIVQKKYDGRGCYADTQTVQYNLSQICVPGGTVPQSPECVQWASICYREP